MDYRRSYRAPPNQNNDMYDDRAQDDDYHRRSSPSRASHNSRKDPSRTPPRRYENYVQDHEDRDRRYEHERDHGYRSPRREGRGRYVDRDREDHHRDRSRSRSPYYGAPPNHTIILEGLPLEMTQEDITQELRLHCRVEALEEVRLIRDKKTGLSRQFAFAQFSGLPEARKFLEENYPILTLHGSYGGSVDGLPAKVRIAYSRDKDDRERPGKADDDWKCEVCFITNYSHRTLCFRCNAPKTRATAHGMVVSQAMSSASGLAANGDSDASPDNTASQFLLFRGLEPGVTEELLATGVSKLYKSKASSPTEQGAGKKLKSSSTSNDASLGANSGSLRRVLLIRDRKTNDSWRYGFAEFNSVDDAQAAMTKFRAAEKFTISSKPVMVSYIHAGVFVPVLQPLNDHLASFSFSPLSNPALRLMYWDESAYASKLITSSPEQASEAKAKQTELARLAAAAANEGLVDDSKDGDSRAKKRKIEKETTSSNKKVVAPHLQFWTNRHAELHGLPPKENDEGSDSSHSVDRKAKEQDAPPKQSFADLARKCCLLCSRQFKTEAEVNKHERMSQLHRENMKNDELVSKALAKLDKSGASGGDNAYRDRAKERRQAFNQPKQPAAQHNRASKALDESESKAETDSKDDAPVQSKGAALLGKMGWNAGEGLGAQGTGRTEAITTEVYAQGVGLGAQGGKMGDAMEEAERQTKGSYADFLNKTKDKAKERFQNM